jgi:hypothetical protein
MVKIDRAFAAEQGMLLSMSTKKDEALTVRCPTCGARLGEKCELSTGLLRTEPHRDRRLAAMDKDKDASGFLPRSPLPA